MLPNKEAVAAALERRKRSRAGENRYRVMMPERFNESSHIGQWTDQDEATFVRRERDDCELLAWAYEELMLDGGEKAT